MQLQHFHLILWKEKGVIHGKTIWSCFPPCLIPGIKEKGEIYPPRVNERLCLDIITRRRAHVSLPDEDNVGADHDEGPDERDEAQNLVGKSRLAVGAQLVEDVGGGVTRRNDAVECSLSVLVTSVVQNVVLEHRSRICCIVAADALESHGPCLSHPPEVRCLVL